MDEKKILVTRPSLPPYEEYVEEIKGIWENRWLTNFGPLEQKLTAVLRDFLGVKELVLTVNGHQALFALISCLGLRGEVITTPFTFASTTHALANCGLTPVFGDVDPVTMTLDPDKAEALINENTCAILPVHVYGTPCKVEKFQKLSEKYGIPVIYDAAHCFGVEKQGKGMGTFGKASIFSFHATKAFNSIEGGAVATEDPELAEKIRRFLNFGLGPDGDCEAAGSNGKMNEFAAAMGLCNLRHIEEVWAGRKAVCDVYEKEMFRADPDFDPKTGRSPLYGWRTLPRLVGVKRNFAYFPVAFEKESGCALSAEEAMERLAAHNIHARRYFYPLTSDFSCYGKKGGDTPVAAAISRSVLSLPLAADMDPEDARKIARILKGE